MIVRDQVATRDLGAEDTIAVHTRTGRKVHAARPGSSVTFCGHWLRANASGYRVTQADVSAFGLELCERCYRDAHPSGPTGPQADCPYCAPDERCALHTGGVAS
jgi:hypothetical protein